MIDDGGRDVIRGMHYTFDIKFSEGMADDIKDLLELPIAGYQFLREVTKAIDMTPMMGPFVERFNHPEKEDESGVSGFIVFIESHASFHTYPARRYLAMDVFSCKEFKSDPVLKLIEDLSRGRIEEIHIEQIVRGEAAFR